MPKATKARRRRHQWGTLWEGITPFYNLQGTGVSPSPQRLSNPHKGSYVCPLPSLFLEILHFGVFSCAFEQNSNLPACKRGIASCPL